MGQELVGREMTLDKVLTMPVVQAMLPLGVQVSLGQEEPYLPVLDSQVLTMGVEQEMLPLQGVLV